MRKLTSLLVLISLVSNAALGSGELKPGPNGIISSGPVSVGTVSAPSSKAVLDLVSTTKGFLPPRMTTTQKNAITSPATGLIVFDTTLNSLQIYNGSAWVTAGAGGISYAADTGSANAYAIAPTPAALAYTTGDMYSFKVTNSNTTSSTLNVSSLGTKNIKTPQVANLPANALIANAIALVVYDGTQFQLINQQDPTRVSPLTTKGDVHTFSTVDARHGVPGDYGAFVADSGSTDNWRNVTYSQVSNGGINKNYVQYADFENNATTGWTATGCATVTNGLCLSVGSGAAAFSSSNGGRAKGANTNSPAINSASSISGTYSLNLATTGAGVIGDGYVSSLLPIDPSDAAKVLTYKFNYKVSSGTPVMGGTATDTYAVAIYSPADNAWLSATPSFAVTQGTGVGTAQGSFQTNSTTTSVQIFIYSPVAPTGTSSLLLDDFYIGPAARTYGAAVTDSTSFTPTGSWSANTTYTAWWWRKGDKLGMKVNIALAGAPTSATLTVNLPSGLTIDTSKLPATPGNVIFPSQLGGVSAAHGFVGFVGYSSTTAVSTSYILDGSTASIMNNSGITQAAPYTFANGDHITFTVEDIPISGWSSNVQVSSDADTRVVTAKGRRQAGSLTVTAATPLEIILDTSLKDTHGALNISNGRFTAPVPGTYIVSFTALISMGATAAASIQAYILKNGTGGNLGINDLSALTNSKDYSLTGTASVDLNAGDYVSLWVNSVTQNVTVNSNATNDYTTMSVFRLSGPAQIAASESVNAKYELSASSAIADATVLNFSNKIFDSHNAVTTGASWKFTAPSSGVYQVSAGARTVAIASGAVTRNFGLTVFKNGSSDTAICQTSSKTTSSTVQSCYGTNIIKLVAGDFIDIRPISDDGTNNSSATQKETFISILRVGN